VQVVAVLGSDLFPPILIVFVWFDGQLGHSIRCVLVVRASALVSNWSNRPFSGSKAT